MSANTKYETLQVSKFCLEGMITIGLIASLYNSFWSYLLHAGPWIGLESGSGSGSWFWNLGTGSGIKVWGTFQSYYFLSSSEVLVLETERDPGGGAGAESSPSYRSATPLPASILSLMQFAIVSSLLPGITQVSWIELLNASLWIMLSFSTATAAPTCGSWTIFRNRRSLSGSSLERIVISMSSTICSLQRGERGRVRVRDR